MDQPSRDDDKNQLRFELRGEDEDNERRRRAGADIEADEPRRKKKRKKKRRSFSFTGAIPLDYGAQIGIAALLGGVCFLGALVGHIDVLYIPGVLACVWGCGALAKNNGRSGMFGLLGLFGPIGFAFTAVLAKPIN